MIKRDQSCGNITNLRKLVFSELDRNPLLSPKSLAILLGFNEAQKKYYRGYIRKLKYDWKRNHQKQRDSIRSCPDEVHNAYYKGVLPKGVVDEVVKLLFDVWGRAGSDKWIFPSLPGGLDGWRQTKSRNHYLLFKSRVGRIRFFMSGTVEIFVRKPASLGRCMQLFSDAFTRHYLISDIRCVDVFRLGLMRRFHGTYKTGQRLPYMKITTFEDTHNFTFISGDRSHPDCYEFIVEYHAEVEQARRLFEELKEGFSLGINAKGVPLKDDYSR
jgi:hypothetical protein